MYHGRKGKYGAFAVEAQAWMDSPSGALVYVRFNISPASASWSKVLAYWVDAESIVWDDEVPARSLVAA